MKLPPELHPQMAEALRRSAEIAAALGPPQPGVAGLRRHADEARAWWSEGGPELALVREDRVPGPVREIPVMVYRARETGSPQPAFVFLHGGGFKLGSHRSNDRQMRELALAWGGTVISADYLHVPEHTFPAPVQETAALLRWLHRAGKAWGIDGERLAFGGASAGANVAFGAAIDIGRVPWLRAAVGIVGAFSDDTGTGSMQRWGDGGLFPDRASAPASFEAYVPDPARRSDPRVALLAGDASLLPPTFLAAAECDVYRDASSNMARRLQEAQRLHAFKVYAGMTHLFFNYSRSVDAAAECVRDVAAFLREYVG